MVFEQHSLASFKCSVRCRRCRCKIYYLTSKSSLCFKCAICGNEINTHVPPSKVSTSTPSPNPKLEYRCDSSTPDEYKKAVAKYYNTDISSITVPDKSVCSSPVQSNKVSSVPNSKSASSKRATSLPKSTLAAAGNKKVIDLSRSKYDVKKRASTSIRIYFSLTRLNDNDKLTDFLTRYPVLLNHSHDSSSVSDSIKSIIQHTFIAKIPANYILSKYETQKGVTLTIRTTNSSFLKSTLGPGLQMLLTGYVWAKSQFCVTDIDIISDNGLTQTEKSYLFSVVYDTPESNNRSLQNIVDSFPSYGVIAKDSIQLWTDYFEWKQQLTKLKIHGVKYVAFRPTRSNDTDIDGISFLCVTENIAEEKAIKSYFQREHDNIYVYTNQVSTERWKFNYNQQNKTDRGILLTFSRTAVGSPDAEIWNASFRIAKKPAADEVKLHLSDSYKEIRQQYQHPCFFELVFTFSSDIADAIQFRDLHGDDLDLYLQKELFSTISYDGFLANSRIGDFALNNRLIHALEDLRAGKAASHNLGNWLFDITNARTRNEQFTNIAWSEWGASHLNESQKSIVKKALQSPDVFLCQGPPGTGKTTVIAEIVYQLTLQGKRVLIASQTNLAVNNALSKLMAYPSVRAIRLGSDRKLDESVEPIRDQNILRTFFNGINNFVKKNYLIPWKEQDYKLESLRHDLKAINDLIKEKSYLVSERNDMGSKIIQVESLIKDLVENEYSKQEKEFLEQHINSYNIAKCDLQSTHYPPAMPFFTRNEACVLFDHIIPELQYLTQSGYRIIPSFVKSNSDLSCLSEQEINDIILSIASLAMVLSAGSSVISNISVQERIDILNEELNQLNDSDDIDYSTFVRVKTIRKKIRSLETGKVVPPLDLIRHMLPENIQGGVNSDKVNIVSPDAMRIAQSIISKFTFLLNQKISEIRSKLESDPNRLKELRLQQEQLAIAESELEQKLISNEKAITLLCNQYNVSHSDLLPSVIQTEINSIANSQSKNISRSDFESFLIQFSQYIDLIHDDYEQENSVYLTSFINACNVVGISCTENSATLTDSGFKTFDVAIIDEVSKATPPEILLPLLISRKAILVGDHRQLPPLFSEHFNSYQECVQNLSDADTAARKLLTQDNYNKFEALVTNSLFKKHYEQASPLNKGALLVQYRMHHEIMDVVNIFYNGLLKSGYTNEQECKFKNHYAIVKDSFGYLDVISPDHHSYWIDTSDFNDHPVYEQTIGTSKRNLFEARVIVEILKQIEISYANSSQSSVDIGVISFYAEQVHLIKTLIARECDFKIVKCDVNTVDRFQGKEKSIVLVSLVRNIPIGSRYDASFVKDYRRINVAMSRAQSLLLIVGAKEMYDTLEISLEDMESGKKLPPRKIYKDIMDYLIMNGCFIRAESIVDGHYESDILANL